MTEWRVPSSGLDYGVEGMEATQRAMPMHPGWRTERVAEITHILRTLG